MKRLDYILNSEKEILAFLKSQYPLYHMSNVFFRDIQYGIQKMFERRDVKIGYTDAEKIAKAFVTQLERKHILVKIDDQSWVLHYPEFRKQAVKPAVAAKPAAPAAAVPRPAAGVPSAAKPPALPPLKSGSPAASPGTLPPIKSSAPAAPKPGGSPPALPPLKSVPPAPKPAVAVAGPPANEEKKATEE